MTDRDPTLQAAIDRAAAELARRIRPWVAGMQDPEGFAERFIADLYAGADNWRPWPRSHKVPDDKPGAPPNSEFKTERARLKGQADA